MIVLVFINNVHQEFLWFYKSQLVHEVYALGGEIGNIIVDR